MMSIRDHLGHSQLLFLSDILMFWQHDTDAALHLREPQNFKIFTTPHLSIFLENNGTPTQNNLIQRWIWTVTNDPASGARISFKETSFSMFNRSCILEWLHGLGRKA